MARFYEEIAKILKKLLFQRFGNTLYTLNLIE